MLLKVGNLKINNEGNSPNKENVKIFLHYAIEKVENIGLSSFVWGRVLTDWKLSKDFDYVVTGNISDYDKLENLFFDLYDYAYNKINLKLDFQWLSNLNIVEINDMSEINYKDVDYIIEKYFERKINDRISFFNSSNNEIYTSVSKWLVKSNKNKNKIKSWERKQHQEESIRKHNGYLNVPALEFLTNIDDYFKE
jgi:hypothetical protein